MLLKLSVLGQATEIENVSFVSSVVQSSTLSLPFYNNGNHSDSLASFIVSYYLCTLSLPLSSNGNPSDSLAGFIVSYYLWGAARVSDLLPDLSQNVALGVK